MSTPIERKCPGCGEVKSFRADQKTCGCLRRKAAVANPGSLSVNEIMSRLAKSETLLQKARIELTAERKQSKFLKKNVLWNSEDVAQIRAAAGQFRFPITPVQRLKVDHTAITPGHSEDAVAIISDTHFGDKSRREDTAGVSQYNLVIGGNRLGYNTESIKQILNIHRAAYKLDTLHLAILGDICHGTLHGSEISNDIFLPGQVLFSYQILRMMIEDLYQSLVKSKIIGAINIIFSVGNHGRLDPDNPMPTKFQSLQTWDRLVYDLLIQEFKGRDRIRINDTFSPFVFENIKGHRYLFSHGLGVGFKNKQETQSKSISSYIAAARAIFDSSGYRASAGLRGTAFERAVIGDVHAHFDYPDLISNGSLTGNNELGLAWLLRPIEPGQVIFGVSKRHRQTWKYFMQSGDIGETNLNVYGQFAKMFLKTWGK
jgi:hypothetical protein